MKNEGIRICAVTTALFAHMDLPVRVDRGNRDIRFDFVDNDLRKASHMYYICRASHECVRCYLTNLTVLSQRFLYRPELHIVFFYEFANITQIMKEVGHLFLDV